MIIKLTTRVYGDVGRGLLNPHTRVCHRIITHVPKIITDQPIEAGFTAIGTFISLIKQN